ncbi:MAG: hypothetical protein AAGI44_07415 [Pseudomonadota bacterium]
MSIITRIVQRYRVAEDPLRTLRRLELVALVVLLLLCLQIGYSAIRLTTATLPASISPAEDSARIPEVLGPSLLEMESRMAVLDRPLFWRSRRPSEAPKTPVESKKSAEQLQDVKLVGVFGSGNRSGVIVLFKGSEKRLLVGEDLDGWELTDIDEAGIHFADGGRRETLRLERRVVKPAAAVTQTTNKTIGREVRAYTQAIDNVLGKNEQQGAGDRAESGDSAKTAGTRKAKEPVRQLGLGAG